MSTRKAQHGRRWFWFPLRFLVVLATVTTVYAQSTAPNTSPNTDFKVLVIPLKAEIDPRTNRLTEKGLDRATEIDADLVIIEMDTYGGAVNDADEISTRILDYPKPVVVFINKDAASAGALISLACDSIYMVPAASIGAATVVNQTGEAAPDKYQSYMRGIMRSMAEANGRDPRIAEAMVDEDLEVEGINAAGKVITFSTSEAIKYGYCEAEVRTIADIMKRWGVQDYTVENYEVSSLDSIIYFFLNPFVSGILILVIIGGLYFELQTPGVGFPLAASLTALVLYLVPYYLAGLAANWEIAAFFVGVILILLEVFVIPGFGLPGITGLVLTLGSLVLIMLNNNLFDFRFVPSGKVVQSLLVTAVGFLGALVVIFVGGASFIKSRFFRRIALQETQQRSQGFSSSGYTRQSLVGTKGTAYTLLRPSGKVMIHDNIYDAYTRGNFIDEGAAIEVISDEGTSLKVRQIHTNAS